MRVFFAHSKAMSDEDIAKWKEILVGNLDGAEVVTGREDYELFAPGAGGFAAWARDVHSRRSVDGWYYDAFFCAEQEIGRGMAEVLAGALRRKAPVVLVGRNGEGFKAARVREVVTVDAENWKSGWWLDT